MPEPTQQYANHRRLFPMYHMVAVPILWLNLAAAAGDMALHPSLRALWYALFSAGVLAGITASRVSVITVQDRVIGLEMRLRLAALLPDDLRMRIPELRLRHLIALRFAGDDELAALVRRCLDGELRSSDEVKRQIRQWRPDFVRA